MDISDQLIQKCCKKAYLRGAFREAVRYDPEKAYHLEFVANSNNRGERLCDLIKAFNLHARLIERKIAFTYI